MLTPLLRQAAAETPGERGWDADRLLRGAQVTGDKSVSRMEAGRHWTGLDGGRNEQQLKREFERLTRRY